MGDAALWATIDLSADGGVEAVRSSRLLRAAARLASGALRCLDVSHCPSYSSFWNAVLDVCAENKASLVSLHYHSAAPLLDDRDVLALRAAAPRTTIYCDVEATASAMLPLLREANSLLRIREARIEVLQPGTDAAGIAQALSQHAPLTRLVLERDDSGTVLGAVVSAEGSLPARLTSVTLRYCGLGPETVPVLTRLLLSAGSALRELHICSASRPLFVEREAVVALSAALRGSRLFSLTLSFTSLWAAPEEGSLILDSLCGHPTLSALSLRGSQARTREARHLSAAACARLLRSSPVLQTLDLSLLFLKDYAISSIFAALPQSRLRTLRCGYNHVSNGAARDSVLPAVLANQSLQELDFGFSSGVLPDGPLGQAVLAVRARAALESSGPY